MHAHGREAAAGLAYARHRPEDTRLYRLVEQHYPTFVAHLAEQGKALPAYQALGAWRDALREHARTTGCVDVARLVYAAHLGLVDEAYQVAETAHLGAAGTAQDIMGPDGYRTSLMFQAGMPELRDDPRFPRLCARLGLVEFWSASGKWPDCVDEVPYDFRAACEALRALPGDPFWR
jgi:hypothetical protein